MSDYQRKIISLPGAGVSPEVTLHRTLDKIDRIKAVTIVIQWDDDTFDCDWSSMKLSELCMVEKILIMEIMKELRENAKGD